MKFFQDSKVGVKIGGSYILIILLFICGIFIASLQLDRIAAINTNIIEHNSPSTTATLKLKNGINHSLSNLYGWMLLGNNNFKQERLDTWKIEIEPAINSLRTLAKKWSKHQITHFNQLILHIEQLKSYQDDIEEVANTTKNNPALEILLNEATPKVNTLMSLITKMMDLEVKEIATEDRKYLFSRMADLRASTASSLASIRTFLLTGQEIYKRDYLALAQKNTGLFRALSNQLDILTPDQQDAFLIFSKIHQDFEKLPVNIFKKKQQEDWQLANYWLRTKTTPLVITINKLITNIESNQTKIKENNILNYQKEANNLGSIITNILLFCSVVVLLLGLYVTRSIVIPIKKIQSLANKISDGNYIKSNITFQSNDEISDLGHSINLLKNILLKNKTTNDKKLKGVVDTAQDAFITIDEKGLIESINSACLDMFGYQEKELINTNVKILMPEPYKMKHDSYLSYYKKSNDKKVIGTGRGVFGQRKDGTTFPAYLSVAEIQLDDGSKVFSGIIRDISQQKDFEDKIKAQNKLLDEQNKLKTQLSEFHEKIRDDKGISELGNNILSYLADLMDIKIGLLYTIHDKKLRLTSQFAHQPVTENLVEIAFGEGLVGQCAIEKKSLFFDDIPSNYITISSGLGGITPKYIALFPIFFNDDIVAILELGSMKKISQNEIDFISISSKNLGIIINSSLNHSKMTVLLMETQRQSKMLKDQQDQLQITNQNLENQTLQLKSSEAELKNQAEALKQSNEELNIKTQDLEVQRSAIEKSRKNLEKKSQDLLMASQYKSEFLANMSHELRTPLNSFLLLSKGLAENKTGNLSKDQLEDINIIYEGGSDLLHLINDILDLSKVEAGKLSLQLDHINLKVSTKSLADLFKVIAGEEPIHFSVLHEDNTPETLFTDVQRMEQVLKNLLSNAFKFTKTGSITLHVHLPEPETEFSIPSMNLNNTLGFSVIDTGIGISEEKQQAIFEAFQQEDGSTERQFGGTGLGLSISKELAKLLGGEIQLVSEKGSGSTFTLYLPLAHEASMDGNVIDDNSKQQPIKSSQETADTNMTHEPETLTQQDSPPIYPLNAFSGENTNNITNEEIKSIKESKMTEEIKSFDNYSILIVDDDMRQIFSLSKQLQEIGLTVFEADTGQTAIHKINDNPNIALLIVDGIDAIEQIKHKNTLIDIPIIGLINKDTDCEKALSLGANACLLKPFNDEQLLELLNDYQLSHK